MFENDPKRPSEKSIQKAFQEFNDNNHKGLSEKSIMRVAQKIIPNSP